MPDTTPDTELRAAAVQLRNPSRLPGLNVGIDTDLAAALADWLDSAAEDAEQIGPDFRALDVARQVLGTTDQQPTPTSSSTKTSYRLEHRQTGTSDWQPDTPGIGARWSWVSRTTADQRLSEARDRWPGYEHRLITITTTVAEAPTDQQPETAPTDPELRDRIALAIEDAPYLDGIRRAWQLADAVLSVLPAPTDRAAALREAANGLAALGPLDNLVSAPAAWTEAIETLRRMADQIAEDDRSRMADEAQQPKPRRRCAHTDVLHGQCVLYLDDHMGDCEFEHQRCTCADAGAAFAPAGHYADCPQADEAQQPDTEAAPQCTAGLLPATDAAVDRCVRRGKHDSHVTAAGARWGNGSEDEHPEDEATYCYGCEHTRDTHLRYGACLHNGCTCHSYQTSPRP